jgi:hypothetical protein
MLAFVAVWSPEGARLITGDQTGVLAVWQADHRGRLALGESASAYCMTVVAFLRAAGSRLLVCKYTKDVGAITNLAFRASAIVKAGPCVQFSSFLVIASDAHWRLWPCSDGTVPCPSFFYGGTTGQPVLCSLTA